MDESDETSFELELAETRRVAKEAFGLDLVSFVYPRNQIAHTDVVQRSGYKNYRGKDAYRFSQSHPLRPLLNFVDEFGALSVVPVAPAQKDNGLYELPGSYFYPRILLDRLEAPAFLRVQKCTGGIKRALPEGKNVHIWFHPQNISVNAPSWIQGFERLFRSIADMRERGQVEVVTMRELSP